MHRKKRNKSYYVSAQQRSKQVQTLEKKIKQQGALTPPVTCPYCGSPVKLEYGYKLPDASKYKNQLIYICSRYPACDAYVGVHTGTTIPLGRLADRELRSLRITLHALFDKLWCKRHTGVTPEQEPNMRRAAAYTWLAKEVQWNRPHRVHIAHLTRRQCLMGIQALYAYFKANYPKLLTPEEEVRVHVAQSRHKNWVSVCS